MQGSNAPIKEPLILVVNDDGIDSPGIVELADHLSSIGLVLVAAPTHQHSGAGRSLPYTPSYSGTGIIKERHLDVAHPERVKAFAVDATPAACIVHALAELAGSTTPDICVSGINFGANLGHGLFASGTIGAAIQAADAGIPSIAVSQGLLPKEERPETFEGLRQMMSTAAEITTKIACNVLINHAQGSHLCLNVNIPAGATLETPIKQAHQASVTGMKWNIPSDRDFSQPIKLEFEWTPDMKFPEDSDMHMFFIDRVVTVTPLTSSMQDLRADPAVVSRYIN